MMVHCSTTMASYAGVGAFGSPSLASWKMKTLSTDLGSMSAEEEKEERKSKSVKRVFTGRSVAAAFLSALQAGGNGTISLRHESLYYTAGGRGR